MNRTRWIFTLLAIVYALPSSAAEKISLAHPVTCNFQYGQYMDSKKAQTDTQKSTLEWNFFNLLDSGPRFLSGGDSGSVFVHLHETSDGVSIWLKQGNGAHLFSIWPDGTAFWSKHNDLLGSKATQQFRGVCTNIRRTN
jgi:hypothetical protein